MNAQFNGDRLKKARLYRGLTVLELAEKSNCQRQTLSMYELGRSQPADKEVVFRLAAVLEFPIKFFYELSAPPISEAVYFRSLLTTNRKYRVEQMIKMEFLAHVYDMLQDYIEFPKFQSISMPEEVTPEEAAALLREHWGLGYGPIDNLISVVEDHGIFVTTFSTSTNDVDAFSELIEVENTPTYLIAYSSNKTSAARIHFDIAHELGHIFLHDWNEDLELLPKEEFKAREREANEFAAAFLLPSESFSRDALRGQQTLLFYKDLKRKWKVSIAAMIHRAKALDIISPDHYQMLIRTMQRRGLRKEEPLDDTLLTAGPALLKTAIIMLIQEGVFTRLEFMQELSVYGLSIAPTEVEYLLDLPIGTLAQPKIIDFESLRLKRNGI